MTRSVATRGQSAAVAPAVETIKADIAADDSVNMDETSWRQAGKLVWLWLAATTTAVYFLIAPTRSRKGGPVREEQGDEARAMRSIVTRGDKLLPANFEGNATTDRYAVYDILDPFSHPFCHCHLRRANKAPTQALIDRGSDTAPVGTALLTASDALFHVWKRYRRGEIDRAAMRAEMAPVRETWRAALTDGLGSPDKRTRRFCKKLNDCWPCLWIFSIEPGVEPTNRGPVREERRDEARATRSVATRGGEQQIRPPVRWRRTSFGTQSDAGSLFAARMLTVFATAQRRGVDALSWLQIALHAHLARKPLPVLPQPA